MTAVTHLAHIASIEARADVKGEARGHVSACLPPKRCQPKLDDLEVTGRGHCFLVPLLERVIKRNCCFGCINTREFQVHCIEHAPLQHVSQMDTNLFEVAAGDLRMSTRDAV